MNTTHDRRIEDAVIKDVDRCVRLTRAGRGAGVLARTGTGIRLMLVGSVEAA
ncbi:hypothetical protein [Roseinatronobacter alkalisoli]|uniref:Uncharacterized protein n=1 Tax=Roseinatronobacter alkalisoli TaxID=3028235 RepID=A0ABT5T8V4_9RHOB|nr:hypothetical protein [Roseinatronobacter sp. HJB301]MDD7970801.1 hypothetical protein [Roseinatronobacter sp. HJB301]